LAKPLLREMLASKQFVPAPGVFDMVSAKLADATEAPALYVTGYGTVASHLGLPDAGLATYTDMIERIGRIAAGTDKPVIADADTGYGGLLNVHHTVRGYEAAGVTAIQIEDQEFPKKCGHTPGRRVIPAEDMAAKIRVASDARSSEDFLIIARTDARTALGLDEARRRAEMYDKAGADIIFIEAPETEEELRLVGQTTDKPKLVNVVHGGKTPVLPNQRYIELGFSIAIFPAVGFLAMAHALTANYEAVVAGGENLPAPLTDFGAFTNMIGFPEIWELEKKFAVIQEETGARS
jgi:2-methylisocitrate lyase-like PEP mutase family enzyme